MVGACICREDHDYRLSVLGPDLPPLGGRRGGLRQLADAIVRKKAEAFNRKIRPVNEDAVDLLGTLDWPGNIRQLSNVLERAIVMSRGKRIGLPTLRAAPDSCSQ